MLKDPFLPFCSFLSTLHSHSHPFPWLHALSSFTSPAQISPAPEPHPNSWLEFLHACLATTTNLTWELDPSHQKSLALPPVSLHIISIIIFQLLKPGTLGSPSAPLFHSLFLNDHQGLPILIWTVIQACPLLTCSVPRHSCGLSFAPTLMPGTLLTYLPAQFSPLWAIQPSHLPVPSNDTIKDRFLTNVIMYSPSLLKSASTFLQNKVNVSQ